MSHLPGGTTMRFKNRYLIARIHGNENISLDSQGIGRYIRKRYLEMFGHVGGAFASSSLAVKYLNNRVIVVRCGRDDVVNVRAVLTFVVELDTQPCLFQVLTISGSVRTCRTAVRNIQHPWHQMDSTIKQQDLALIDAIEH